MYFALPGDGNNMINEKLKTTLHNKIEIAPTTSTAMTYREAVLYCQFLEINGHTDWRIPTVTEYFTISEILGWYIPDSAVRLQKRWVSNEKQRITAVRDVC